MHLPRVVRDPLAEAFEDPAHLGVDADEAERGVDEHPRDGVAAEDDQVEDDVHHDREAAVHVQEPEVGPVGGVRHHEARRPVASASSLVA